MMSHFEEESEDWDVHPKSEAEAAAWRRLELYINIQNVAKSKFSGESIIREMGAHAWNGNNENLVPAALLSNPNLTPELLSWLDSAPGAWSTTALHDYWIERYKLNKSNSNFYPGEEQSGPTRSFHVGLIDSKLDFQTASSAVLEMSDHFAEQMWHDLAKQKHLTLNYWNSENGEDKFFPEFGFAENEKLNIFELDEEVLNQLSPGIYVTWIEKEASFDRVYAQTLAEDSEGQEHFLEGDYVQHAYQEPFPSMNLGLAIGAGKQYGDIDLVDSEIYDFYLQQIYGDDVENYETKVTIAKDTPWEGIGYRELNEQQQMNLAVNLLSTMDHPYLGRPDGISRHFLCCLALHDDSAEKVKAFLLWELND
jgi:hypothetical protein